VTSVVVVVVVEQKRTEGAERALLTSPTWAVLCAHVHIGAEMVESVRNGVHVHNDKYMHRCAEAHL
jgi:hypothetical protein